MLILGSDMVYSSWKNTWITNVCASAEHSHKPPLLLFSLSASFLLDPCVKTPFTGRHTCLSNRMKVLNPISNSLTHTDTQAQAYKINISRSYQSNKLGRENDCLSSPWLHLTYSVMLLMLLYAPDVNFSELVGLRQIFLFVNLLLHYCLIIWIRSNRITHNPTLVFTS